MKLNKITQLILLLLTILLAISATISLVRNSMTTHKPTITEPTPEPSPQITVEIPTNEQLEPSEPPCGPTSCKRYELTQEERSLVERVVMAEAGNQPLEGQMAVAQCILNSSEATGKRPDAIVYAPYQYAAPADAKKVTESVKKAVSMVFDHGDMAVYEPIRYFYAPKHSAGTWHESSLEYVTTIQDHKFFKLKD